MTFIPLSSTYTYMIYYDLLSLIVVNEDTIGLKPHRAAIMLMLQLRR